MSKEGLVISGDAVEPFSPNICNMFTTPNLYFHTKNINPVYIKGIISQEVYVPRGIVGNMALPSSALKKGSRCFKDNNCSK